MTLEAHGRSASLARRMVTHAVEEAGLRDVLDEALLLVSEVVTNAVVHAGTELELAVVTSSDSIRIDVTDRSPGSTPVLHQRPDETREGGRGVFLIESLATEWGTRHFHSGKTVWFLLGAASGDTAATSELPLLGTSPRRDLAWLVEIPADLEQQLSPSQTIGELWHRLIEALALPKAWLATQTNDDQRRWQLVLAHNPEGEEFDVEALRRSASTARGHSAPAEAGLLLPLRSRTGVFGALVLGGDSLHADDIALARLVGDRISVILRDERAQARQMQQRGSLALLAEASEMFAGTLDVTLALSLAAQLIVPRLATWVATCTTFDEHAPRLVSVTHRDETATAKLKAGLSTREGHELVRRLSRDLVEQRPVLVAAAELPAVARSEGGGDTLGIPLVARRRPIGLLLVGRPPGSSYDTDALELLVDLARRAALAVDNARLYEERTLIAQALQASLLPPALPESDVVQFGARYAAAGEGNDVGGDFYDVFALPHGGWGVAIGDVCGKGPKAAAITGMARDVLRLLSQQGVPVPDVLQRLNDAILELGERSRFCTAILATVQPDEHGLAVRFSSAGHPHPVHVSARGDVSFVGRSGTLLGVLDVIEVSEDVVRLDPGDALVLYTDGVTERRNGTSMFGDHELLTCLRASARSGAGAIAGHLEQQVQRFGSGVSRDDLAVLVIASPGP